ncbi:MAG: ABC transporter permease [Bacteroidota bacterium]
MGTNWVTFTVRYLARHRSHALLNVLGLAIGLACCLLIAVFVRDELSYDRFHEHAESIYRLVMETEDDGVIEQRAAVDGPIGATLVREYPRVIDATRVWPRTSTLVQSEGADFYEERILRVDPSFFEIFSFPFLEGTPAMALSQQNAIVLTRSAAQKYFGSTSPLGQVLTLGDRVDHTVTAVVDDPPSNSHLQFDFLTPIPETLYGSIQLNEWGKNRALVFYTYLRMQDQVRPQDLEAQLPGFASTYLDDLTDEDVETRLFLEPLLDLHLHSTVGKLDASRVGIRYTYALSVVALFILLLAAFNYTNLSTARAIDRAREIGVRKTSGAHRTQLIRQFLAESTGLSLVALVLALVLATVALPFFGPLTQRSFTVGALLSPALLAAFVGFAVVVGMLAGAFPAFYLSSFNPSAVLKGRVPLLGAGMGLRKTLVVLQFAISIGLIVTTLGVRDQVDYLQSKTLRLEGEQTVRIPLEGDYLRSNYQAFKQKVSAIAGVQQVTGASGGLTKGMISMSPEAEGTTESPTTDVLYVDTAFVSTLGLEVVAGRDLSSELVSDVGQSHLINEAAVRAYGWSDPIGKRVPLNIREADGNLNEDKLIATVVGVVKDVQYEKVREAADPLLITLYPTQVRYAFVRLDAGQALSALDEIEGVFDQFAEEYPFSAAFMDDEFDALYRAEERMGRVFGTFTVLAVLIACLGLLGLSALIVSQRTKEIGIRKVLGAPVRAIVVLFSKEFAPLVVIATLVAAPLAYVALQRWLESYAYRVQLGLETPAVIGGLALLVVVLIVSAQAVRAALRDPTETLRYD